jgi:serine/threonine-protein kinase
VEPVAFGKYLLVERLAQGGMAEVFRAVYRPAAHAPDQGAAGVEKTVALKRILPGLDGATEFVQMFIDEARIAASLTHVNVAQVFDFGEVDGTYYLAMELVDGVDLGRLAEAQRKHREKPGFPPAMAAFLVAEAARGLAYAHERRGSNGALLGIVHRDISPQNILCSYAGEVKIADFGIAKAVGKLHKTASGAVMGKLRYMSPEQITGEPLDGRSDIFSLGVVLWELLTAAQLFHGDNPGAVTEQVKKAEVAPPSSRMSGIGAELDRICLKALARDREARYPRAGDLARDLSAFVAAESPGLSRDELAAWIVSLVPRTSEPEPAMSPSEAVAPTMPKPVASPTRRGHVSPPPPARVRRPWALLGLGLLAGGAIAIALRDGKSPPTTHASDLGTPALAASTPPLPSAPMGDANREQLLAQLEQLPQAAAAWRGVASEDYVAILSAAEAALCATPPDAKEPSLPSDVLDRLDRRKVTGEARAVARYLLATGELPDRVRLSLKAFLRGRPAFSPGPNGWAAAALATQLEPEEPRHLEELVRENGALRRWRESPPPGRPPARFADLCERQPLVARLAALVPGAFAAALMRYLAALPIDQSVDEGGLRFAVTGGERDEAAATLTVRLRVTNPGAEERELPLGNVRLSGVADAPQIDPPASKLGAGLVREVRLIFSTVPDAAADAAVLILRPGLELAAYSEVLR